MEKTHMCDFLIGLSMGATTALLFAPYSGKKTRARITEAANNGGAYVKHCSETVSDAVLRVIDDIARQKEGVTEAIKRGTHVYKQAVS